MKKIKKYKYYVIAVAAVVAISIVAGFFINYNRDERFKVIETNLNSIADLKAAQVSDWLSERMEDAQTLQQSPNSRILKQYIQNPNNKNLSEEIVEWLSSIKQQFAYDDVWLLDQSYNVITSLNGGIAAKIKKPLLEKLRINKQVYFSDLYRSENSDSLYFEIIVPMIDESENIYCFLTFRKSPHSRLFPMIQYWPVKSNTAESILFRIENERVVFLNELKHKDSVPLNFSIPYRDTNFWGSTELVNFHGLIDSRDYRGEDVLALIKKVPDSNWYLKIKIDKAEVLSPIRQETTTYILMLVLVAALLLLFAYQMWKMKNITHLEKLLAVESEKNRLQKVYDQVSQNANDSIFLLDENLTIIEANEIALRTYGYTHDEFIKLKADHIRVDEEASQISKQYELSKKQSGIVFNTRHKKKNGAVFPVEVSLSSFISDDVRYFISVVRDITERVDAENKIKNLNRLYAVLSQINAMIVREKDEKQLFTRACDIIAKYGGYGIVSIVSKSDKNELSTYGAGFECKDCQKAFHAGADKFEPLFNKSFNGGYLHSRGLSEDTYIGPDREGLLKQGFKSAVYVPIYKSSKLAGALIVFIKENTFFDDVTIDLFKELAGDLSFAVTNIEQSILKAEAELKIKESERKLSTIVQNMPGVVYRCKNDATWTMEFVAKNITKLSGWNPEDIIGNKTISFNDLIHPDDRERIWEEVQEKIVEIKTYNLKYRIIHKDGTIKSVTENAQPVINRAGELEAIEGIIFDVSELEEAKSQLEETEGRYKNLIDNSALGIAMADLTGRIIIANSAFSQLLNHNPKELFGINYRDLDIEDSLKIFLKEKFIQTARLKTTLKYEDEINLPAGRLTISAISTPVYNNKNKLIGVQLITSDVTQQRKQEGEIRKLSQSVEQNPVSVFITNIEGEIEYANPALVKQTGYELEEILGQNPRLFKSGLMEKQVYINLWNTVKAGNVFENEMLNKKKTGELYWEKATIAPIKDQDGNITNFVALKEDITQKKILEDELKRQRDKAEEMNRIKTYFFNNMSHELRTPMVGILGYLELMLMEDITEDHRNMLSTVFKSSRRLHETLNSILDLSKLESAETIVNYRKINLSSILTEASDLFLLLAEGKNLFIKIENKDGDLEFVSDENLLSKIITNLVSNSIKYTSEGGIYLRSRRDRGNIVIEVEDTGIGIDEKYHQVVFEPFRQVSEGMSRVYEGAGLGLSIVKSFIELLDGSITIQSKVGSGTKLVITLPGEVKEAEPEAIPSKIEVKEVRENILAESEKKILLVEDDSVNAGYVSRLLGPDHTVEIVSEGNEAILKGNETRYDLILMDIGLKGEVDGVEAARAIKKSDTNSSTPIIAITAYAMVGDRERFLKAGLDDYLSKPFSRAEFINIVDKYLSV